MRRETAAVCLALVLLLHAAAPAAARPRDVNTKTAHGRIHALQPISYRLLGMGDLDIAVRDPLNQTSLYQLGGISAGLGLEQYTDWLAPNVLLESPSAASTGTLPLLFPTDALAMSYRGRSFYVDFVLEIDNTPVTYRLAFEIRNVSPPE